MGNEYARLPKGETIEIDLEEGEDIPLLLAKHVCQVVHDGDLYFVDDAFVRTELKMGPKHHWQR